MPVPANFRHVQVSTMLTQLQMKHNIWVQGAPQAVHQLRQRTVGLTKGAAALTGMSSPLPLVPRRLSLPVCHCKNQSPHPMPSCMLSLPAMHHSFRTPMTCSACLLLSACVKSIVLRHSFEKFKCLHLQPVTFGLDLHPLPCITFSTRHLAAALLHTLLNPCAERTTRNNRPSAAQVSCDQQLVSH